MMKSFYTIGHSTRTSDEFIALLQENEIECLVDVRSYPGSKHCPQFNKETLSKTLEASNIRYDHILKLGGRRNKSKVTLPEVNALWTHSAFHNYADYTLTSEFADGLSELEKLGKQKRVAYMCSEAVWWKCHRRIITDYLLASNHHVINIMGSNKMEIATPTTNSGCCDGKPTYRNVIK